MKDLNTKLICVPNCQSTIKGDGIMRPNGLIGDNGKIVFDIWYVELLEIIEIDEENSEHVSHGFYSTEDTPVVYHSYDEAMHECRGLAENCPEQYGTL